MESNVPVTYCVYLGPTIKGVIQNANIYAGTVEEACEQQLQMQLAKFPRIKNLIVPAESFPVDRVKVKTPGNYLYEQYRLFVKELRSPTKGGN